LIAATATVVWAWLEAESVCGPFVIGNGSVFGNVDFLAAVDAPERRFVVSTPSDVYFG